MEPDDVHKHRCDVPATLPAVYDHKYVLLRVRKAGGAKYVVVSRPLPYHQDIVDEYRTTHGYASTTHIQVLGGGLLHVEGATVHTFGRSGAFGPVAAQYVAAVERCLRERFATHDVQVTVTDYVRG